MKFADAVRAILELSPDGLTPQEVREQIKSKYPEYYGTESHVRNVEKGHYKDIAHAVLAQIYIVPKYASDIFSDKSTKPITLSSWPQDSIAPEDGVDELETEDLHKLEVGLGTVYVLGTNLYTKDCLEIVKVGITTGSIEARIRQLYTTGVPFRFRLIRSYETSNYAELEQSLHKLLDPYRINRSREFFTERCLDYVERVVAIHDEIQESAHRSKI